MSTQSCPTTGNVSFPLQTTLTDTNAYFNKISQETPDIKLKFKAQTKSPYFSDDSRNTGDIYVPLGSIIASYKSIQYNLISSQICLPTHTKWLGKDKKNKIDIIFTFETEQSKTTRFIIIVLPLILSDNPLNTTNNAYLQGIASMTEGNVFSVESLFTGLSHYFYYTTCLEPHGDNTFVYVNIDGISISEELYYNLLASWKDLDVSSIKVGLHDTVNPIKKTVQFYLEKIKSSTSLNDIQNRITNLQAETQLPILNTMIETWPKYTPPYDITLNIPTRYISTMPSRVEGFQVDYGNGVTGYTSSQLQTITDNAENEGERRSLLKARTAKSLDQVQCVPLDLDNATDASGNINFNAEGSVVLQDVENNRNSLRNHIGVNKISGKNLETYLGIAIAVLIFIIIVLLSLTFFFKLGDTIKPDITTSPINVLKYLIPNHFINITYYITIGLIFAFSGFLIGASVSG